LSGILNLGLEPVILSRKKVKKIILQRKNKN
jgi:hypothetical protein